MSWKRELIEVRETLREALVEAKRRRAAIWPRDKDRAEERNKLTTECRRLLKITKEIRWDVAARVLR